MAQNMPENFDRIDAQLGKLEDVKNFGRQQPFHLKIVAEKL